MTDYNGFGTGTPGTLAWQNDSGAYTFGSRLRVDTSGLSAIKVRWFIPSGSPAAPTTGYYVALYEVGNTTAVATAGPVGATVGAWNEASISPVALTSGADYVAAVFYPGGYYGAVNGFMPYDPAGPINFYSTGVFNSGGALAYPGTSSGASPWYGVDVTVSDGTSSNDGSGTPASGATTAAGTGSVGMDGSGTAAAGATTAAGAGALGMDGTGTAASGATTAAGSSGLASNDGSGTAAGRATTALGYGTGPVGGFAAARAELVQLLAGIPGVVALPYPIGVPAQGLAWPVLGRLDLSRYGEATWVAVFVAGGDGRTGERWLDDNLETVLAALRPWMYVDTVTPVDLGNNVVGVQFAGRREI